MYKRKLAVDVLEKSASPPRTDPSARDVFKREVVQEGQLEKPPNIDIAEAIVQTLLDELNQEDLSGGTRM